MFAVMTRLKDKDVELILDIDPTLPNRLYGDNIRIKQVLLNLTNNAAKFTWQGRILVKGCLFHLFLLHHRHLFSGGNVLLRVHPDF